MKDNSQVNAIIIKAITNEALTSAESAILDQWLADAGNSELFQDLKNEEYLLQKLREANEVDVEGDKAFLQQQLAIGKRINIKRQWKLFRDVATSAAAVLILAAATFLWFNTRESNNDTVSKENVKTAAPAYADIAPGKTKALLTLADGRKIILDSTVTGQLAQQGETVLINEKGALKYRAKGSAQNEGLFNTLTTANGETYSMVLADGSKIWLNAGASVRYPVAFTGIERKVEITGEAYFEVAHDINKPFIVHVPDQKGAGMDVQVLGTRFNINAYNDEVEIKATLLEGSVKIKQNRSQTLLKPGQQARVSNNGITTVLDDANVDAAIAWKNGRFNFENADIAVVMRALAKWYDIEVVYEGPKFTHPFMGEMERNLMLSQVVRALEYTTGIHFRVEGKKLIVISPELYESQQNDTNQHK